LNYINLIGVIKKYEVDSYKVRFEDNYFWYPADQIQAHLLPEKKTKKERIEELEKRVEQLESDFKDFCSYVEFKILEPESKNKTFFFSFLCGGCILFYLIINKLETI